MINFKTNFFMKRTFKKLCLILMACVPVTFFSCTDEVDDDATTVNSALHKYSNYTESQLKHYLTFDDFDAFLAKLAEIEEMDSAKIVDWENSLNFISLRRIADNIESAEEEMLNGYEDYSDEELSQQPEVHSAIFDEMSDILVKEIDSEDGSYYYDVDVSNYRYSPLLNKLGIVKIGNDIYQFKRDAIKIIRGGNEDLIDDLQNVSVSDEKLNIEVIPLTDNQTKASSYYNSFEHKRSKTRHCYKVILYHRFYQNTLYDNSAVFTLYSTRVKSLKKYFGKCYLNYKVRLNVSTTYSGNTTYGYYYSNNNQKVYCNRTWMEANHYMSSRTSTLEYYYYDRPFYSEKNEYGQFDNLPKINYAKVTVSANKRSNISFTSEFNN